MSNNEDKTNHRPPSSQQKPSDHMSATTTPPLDGGDDVIVNIIPNSSSRTPTASLNNTPRTPTTRTNPLFTPMTTAAVSTTVITIEPSPTTIINNVHSSNEEEKLDIGEDSQNCDDAVVVIASSAADSHVRNDTESHHGCHGTNNPHHKKKVMWKSQTPTNLHIITTTDNSNGSATEINDTQNRRTTTLVSPTYHSPHLTSIMKHHNEIDLPYEVISLNSNDTQSSANTNKSNSMNHSINNYDDHASMNDHHHDFELDSYAMRKERSIEELLNRGETMDGGNGSNFDSDYSSDGGLESDVSRSGRDSAQMNTGTLNNNSIPVDRLDTLETTTSVVPAPGNPVQNMTLPSEMFNHIQQLSKSGESSKEYRKRLRMKVKRGTHIKLKRPTRSAIQESLSKTKKTKRYVQELMYGSPPKKVYEVSSHEDLNNVKILIIDLIYALLCFGMPAYRIDYHATLISTCYGVGCMVDFTGNGFLITFTTGFGSSGHDTRYIKLKGAAWDLNKLCMLDDLAADVAENKLTVTDAQKQIKVIIAQKPIYSHVLCSFFVYFVCSGVFATLTGCLWQEILGALISGIFVCLVVIKTPIYAPSLAPITHSICAMAASIVCIVLKVIFQHFRMPFQTITPALISTFMLLPGLTFTLSISELARRHVRAGLVRLLGGMLAGVQIGAVLVVCQIIESSFHFTPIIRTAYVYPWWISVLAVPLGALSFIVGLKVPHEPLPIMFIIADSYVTYFLTRFIGQLTIPELGAFVGAFSAQMVSLLYGWISHRHPTIVTCCVILFEVPGSLSVKAIVSLINKDVNNGTAMLVQAMITGLAIGLGLILADFLPLHHRHKNLGFVTRTRKALKI